jgi:hypothetical protein
MPAPGPCSALIRYAAMASAVATLVTRLTVGLDDTRFGIDFNPAANALRIVSDTGQNLRHLSPACTGSTS